MFHACFITLSSDPEGFARSVDARPSMMSKNDGVSFRVRVTYSQGYHSLAAASTRRSEVEHEDLVFFAVDPLAQLCDHCGVVRAVELAAEDGVLQVVAPPAQVAVYAVTPVIIRDIVGNDVCIHLRCPDCWMASMARSALLEGRARPKLPRYRLRRFGSSSSSPVSTRARSRACT